MYGTYKIIVIPVLPRVVPLEVVQYNCTDVLFKKYLPYSLLIDLLYKYSCTAYFRNLVLAITITVVTIIEYYHYVLGSLFIYEANYSSRND